MSENLVTEEVRASDLRLGDMIVFPNNPLRYRVTGTCADDPELGQVRMEIVDPPAHKLAGVDKVFDQGPDAIVSRIVT